MTGVFRELLPGFFAGAVSKRAANRIDGDQYSVGSATRQGSSSLTRFIGQSAMTSRHNGGAFWLHSVQFACPDQGCTAALPALLHDPNRRTGSFCGPC